MNRWWRRIRAAIGMGVAWGLAWFAAGIALLFVVGPDAADVPFPLGFGFLGFLAGAMFSGVLSILPGRRSFDQLSIPRFAGWGAVGGVLFAMLFVLAVATFGNNRLDLLGMSVVFGAAGAATAAGSLALARRAQPELAGEDRNAAGSALADPETRPRIGGVE